MTKEDPDQLINVCPYLVPIGQLIERSGWSYQETLDYAAIATAMHEARSGWRKRGRDCPGRR
jgi:hypothetical protein